HLADGRLEAHSTTQGRWDTYGPTGVSAQSHGHKAGTDGYPRTIARTARYMRYRMPGIVGCPMVMVDTRGSKRKLDGLGFPQQDHPSLVEATHNGRIRGRNVVE